jgi:hypothetical protein
LNPKENSKELEVLSKYLNIPIEKLEKIYEDINIERLKPKALIALPYFLSFPLLAGAEGLKLKGSYTLEFEWISDRIGMDLDDLKLFLVAMNIVISNKEYKEMKNEIREKLEITELEKINDEDQNNYLVSPVIEDNLDSIGQDDCIFTQIDQAHYIWSKTYSHIVGDGLSSLRKTTDFENKLHIAKTIVIEEFFWPKIHKKLKEEKQKDLESQCELTFQIIKKDRKLIELIIGIRLDWFEIFQKLLKGIEIFNGKKRDHEKRREFAKKWNQMDFENINKSKDLEFNKIMKEYTSIFEKYYSKLMNEMSDQNGRETQNRENNNSDK